MIVLRIKEKWVADKFLEEFNGFYKESFDVEEELRWILNMSYEETLKHVTNEYERDALILANEVEEVEDVMETALKLAEKKYREFVEIERALSGKGSIKDVLKESPPKRIKEYLIWRKKFFLKLINCLNRIKKYGKKRFLEATLFEIDKPIDEAEFYVFVKPKIVYNVFIKPEVKKFKIYKDMVADFIEFIENRYENAIFSYITSMYIEKLAESEDINFVKQNLKKGFEFGDKSYLFVEVEEEKLNDIIRIVREGDDIFYSR